MVKYGDTHLQSQLFGSRGMKSQKFKVMLSYTIHLIHPELHKMLLFKMGKEVSSYW